MPLYFAFLVLGAACAQAGRVLAVPAVPGAHPLRALGSADGAVRLLAPEWAELSCAADPALARNYVFLALGTEWQWTARPAEYARVLGSSGLLRQSTRLLALGGAYVKSLEGRCVEPCVALRPLLDNHSNRDHLSAPPRRAAARRPGAF